LSTTNNDYFEFAATTTNYTGIGFTFDARLDANLHGPRALRLYSSTDGSTFTACMLGDGVFGPLLKQ
jgi:hypothetical protein